MCLSAFQGAWMHLNACREDGWRVYQDHAEHWSPLARWAKPEISFNCIKYYNSRWESIGEIISLQKYLKCVSASLLVFKQPLLVAYYFILPSSSRICWQSERWGTSLWDHRPAAQLHGEQGQHRGDLPHLPAQNHAHLLQVWLQGPPAQPGPTGRVQGKMLHYISKKEGNFFPWQTSVDLQYDKDK